MTFGGNKFNYFSKNQLTKFSTVWTFWKYEVLLNGSAVPFCMAVSSWSGRKSAKMEVEAQELSCHNKWSAVVAVAQLYTLLSLILCS